MSDKSIPAAPQFATAEEAEAYLHWLQSKVQTSLDDERASMPHHEVMAALQKILENKHKPHGSDPMAT
jgi:hypothetical protein